MGDKEQRSETGNRGWEKRNREVRQRLEDGRQGAEDSRQWPDQVRQGTEEGSSVADLGCLSRLPDPDFYPSRIPEPGSRISDLGSRIQKKEGWKKFFCHTFLCSHKSHKIENYFSFEVLKTKIWANFQRIIEFFPKKLSLSSQKYGFGIRDPGSEIQDPGSGIRDPGSGIRKKPISDPRSRIQGSKRHRIPDPVSRSATMEGRQGTEDGRQGTEDGRQGTETWDRGHRTLVKEQEKGTEERVTWEKTWTIPIKTLKRHFLTKCGPKWFPRMLSQWVTNFRACSANE
jgi:hypothetical protein